MRVQKIALIFTLIFLFWADQMFSQTIIPTTMNISQGINEWVNIGPEGGTASDIAYDPENPQTVFSIISDQEVYKSNDGGLSWTVALPKLSTDQILRHLAVARSNDSLIIYAAGYQFFRSSDGGNTWQQLTPTNNFMNDNNDIIVDPVDPQVVYLATQIGIFKSTDAGASWTEMNNGLTYTNISQLAISPANHNIIYAACGEEPLIFKITNKDTAWSVVYQGEMGIGNHTSTIAIDPTNVYIVYASVWGEENFLKTIDGGKTWTHISSEGGAFVLVVDPIFPDVLYFGKFCGLLYKSYDGGNTWTKLTDGRSSFGDITCIAINPIDNSKLLLGTVGCIFKSTDGGLHWEEAIAGLAQEDISTIVFDIHNPDVIFLGAVERGFVKSNDHGITWQANNEYFQECDYWVYSVAVNPISVNELFCGNQNGIYKSIDGGETWIRSTNGINEAPGGGIGSILFDPNNTNVIYVGIKADLPFPIPEDKKVYKSTDGGANWTSMSNGITHIDVRALILNPQNSSVLYAGTFGGGIFKTMNGAVSWSAVNNGIDDMDILTLAMDPDNPNVIYAGTANGHIYKTTDSGDSWYAISSPATTHSINVLLVNPDISKQVLCGADRGFFLSQDAGETWYSFNTGLTNQDIRAIALDPTDSRIVYAGTAGGSAFRTTISPDVLIGPSRLSFGEVPVDSSKTLYVSLVNSSPVLNLEVRSLMIGGPDSADFSYNGPGSFTMVPMETHGVEVVFSPTSTGEKNAILVISHNGASSPDTVLLSGIGVSATGFEDSPPLESPEHFALYPNYPNPFNPSTTIRFVVPEACRVEISIYDVLGKRIRTLIRAWYRPGSHAVMWDGRDMNGLPLPTGEYLVRMEAGEFVAVRKVLLLK